MVSYFPQPSTQLDNGDNGKFTNMVSSFIIIHYNDDDDDETDDGTVDHDDHVDPDDDDDDYGEGDSDLVSLNDASPGAEGSCSRRVRAAALQKKKGK